jgi:cytochrome c peroxidase
MQAIEQIGATLVVLALTACEQGASPPATDAGAVPETAAPDAGRLGKLGPFEPAPIAPAARGLVELGQLLFFDPRLSGDDTFSCATCHDPKKAYTDGRAKGVGYKGEPLTRNTPTIVNVDQRLPLFWDGRAPTVEEQALMPVANPVEMGQDIDALTRELETVAEYVARFKREFRERGITSQAIAKALGAFERSVTSSGSPFDRYLAGESSAMSPAAVRGLELFVGKAECIKCHDGPQLSDNGFHNIGVASADIGRYQVVQVALMRGAFKTPGLRDVALTAPYFHDGSAATLAAVVEHYVKGGVNKENLDPDIHPLDLSPAEQADLVSFMEALTGHGTPPAPLPVPGAYASKSKKTLDEIMKQSDGMLEALDALFASLREKDLVRVEEHCDKLLENAETLDVQRAPSVPRARWLEFREHQGNLVLALKTLQRAVTDRDHPHDASSMGAIHKMYKDVREQCNACHEVFREDKENKP